MRSVLARRVIWFLSVVVGFIGFIVSGYLVQEHYESPAPPSERQEAGLLDQACTAFAASDCGKVIKQSRWGVFPPRKLDEEGKIILPKEGERAPSIPTAELGMYYWTAVLVWLFVIGIPSPDRAWVHAIYFLVAFLGLGFCAFLAYVMFFGEDLEAWCPLCTVTHICGLLLVILAALMWPRSAPVAVVGSAREKTKAAPGTSGAGESDSLFATSKASGAGSHAASTELDRAGSWPPTYLLGMVAFVILIAMFGERSYSLAMERQAKLEQSQKVAEFYEVYYKEFRRNMVGHGYAAWTNYPPVEIDLEGVPMRGSEDAEHTIVVFSNFQCPGCGAFEKVLEEFVRPAFEQLGGARIYYKHWPISPDCNPYASRDVNPLSCKAALAAEAALILGGQEAFWEMHDLLYANQTKWKAEEKETLDFTPYARQIGLDEEAFREAMDSDEAKARILDDIEDSRKLPESLSQEFRERYGDGWVKVNSTPSVYLDGRVVTPAQSRQLWLNIMRTVHAEKQRKASESAQDSEAPARGGEQPAGEAE